MRLIDVAGAVRRSPSFISAIETGRKKPPDEFIDELIAALALSPEEVEQLMEASELSKQHVVIRPKTIEAALLAKEFEKKIDKLTPEQIREILSNYFAYSTRKEKDRFRKDRRVPPKWSYEIWQRANLLRTGLGYAPNQKIHIAEILDWDLPKLFPEFALHVLSPGELPLGVLGLSRLDPPQIIVPEQIYVGAVFGEHRARWVMAHELGHLWLCHGDDTWFDALPSPLDVLDTQISALESAEYQADEFAASLLMPAGACSSMTAAEISDEFGVSEYVARKRVKFLR